MTFLVIAIIIGLLPAAIAAGKGRNFMLWWLYGAALWIIATPHSLMLKRDKRQEERKELAEGAARKCPHCAELIRPEAKVCRYCGRDVEPVASAIPEQRPLFGASP